MAEIIEMPKLSDTMEEGVVAAWHKKVGEKVEPGELLAEIETDKATMDFEATDEGTLLYIAIDAGGTLSIGQLLAIIGEEGEDVKAILSEYQNGSSQNGQAEAPASEPQQQAPAAETTQPAAQPAAPATTAATTESGRIKASPLARAMAREQGIDLAALSGTGDGGRIVKRDIENYVNTQPATQAAPQPAPQAAPAAQAQAQPVLEAGEDYRDEPLSLMRKTIARKLQEVKQQAPHFYLTMEIDMEKAISTRKMLNEISPVKISYNDMIIKAAAAALAEHPQVNASWMGDRIRYHNTINVGMAVAIDQGLVVPVVRNADKLGLSAIAAETKDLAVRARDRKLQIHEMEGNTFSISNLGMFGIEEFTAIINPPDACIMAVGGIMDVPVVKDGEIVPGKRMRITLSCDHRVVDGAVGSRFLQSFKAYMEEPLRIML